MAYYKEFQRLIPNKEAQPFAINMELAKRGTYNITFVSIMLQSVPTIFLSFLHLLVRLVCLCRIRKGGHVNML